MRRIILKNVGIMSMQRIYNYGSFLQAYGLKKIIEEIDETSTVSFVDYRIGDTLEKNAEPKGIKRKIKKIFEYNKANVRIKDKINFFKFKKNFSKNFSTLGLPNKPNYNPQVDLLIIGSDEVFNCVQSNTNVGFSSDLFGHNLNAKKIVSYAGSFGNTTIEKIRNYKIDGQLTDYFQNFSSISVRDENSYQIISNLVDRNVSINIDPVLAYDFMNKERKIPNSRVYNERYMIVYGYSGRFNNDESETIKIFAKRNKLKILCFGGLQDCCDEFINCTPFELLAYFRDAEYIITDTFHGTIFSIINNKNFITLIRSSNSKKYGNEEKLTYLLKLFDLDNKATKDLSLDFIEAAYEQDIPYEEVNKKLNQYRSETRTYLKNNM